MYNMVDRHLAQSLQIHRESERVREKLTHTHTHRLRDKEADRQKERRDTHTDSHTQTKRHKLRHTDRETDTQRGPHTKTSLELIKLGISFYRNSWSVAVTGKFTGARSAGPPWSAER